MNFRTNFSKLCLLSNEVIKIYFEDKIVEFVPPTMKLYFNDLEFAEFKVLLKQNPKEFSKLNSIYQVTNEYEVFLAILKSNYKTEIILYFLNLIFPNINYIDSQLKINNIPLTYEEYMLLIDFLEVSCGEKDFKEFMEKINPENQIKETKNKELSEIARRMKETEDKLNELKKNKKTKAAKDENAITIDQIVVAILYEFPSLRLEDILNMNVYTLLTFWDYVGKVVDIEIQKIAAGNGLIKDFTYFIN